MNPNVRIRNIGGLDIPEHDHITVAYHGATNNIDTVTYRVGGAGGTVVATLTLTYVGGVPSSNDANLETVTKS